MGSISAPTRNPRHTRPRRTSIEVYRPPVARGERGFTGGGSLLDSMHAPNAAALTTEGGSYADIAATSSPKFEAISSPPCETDGQTDFCPAPAEESATSAESETVLADHLDSLHLAQTANPIVRSPSRETSAPTFPQVPSEISTFELPSPVSTRESSCLEEKPETSNTEPLVVTTSKKFDKKKRYGRFTFSKGDPEKLERLNHSELKLESRWASE